MARKKRMFPDGILPQGHRIGENIDISARFCYFLELNNWTPPHNRTGGLKQHKQNLYNNAKEAIITSIKNQIVREDGHSTETIESAVKFLGDIAQYERQKEVQLIHQYANNLRNSLPEALKNDSKAQINQLIQRVENFANNPDNGDMDTFYQELTICINDIRKSALEMKNRLEQITSNNRDTYAKLASDTAAFRFGSDVDGLIKNVIGIKTRRKEDSFAGKVQDLVIEYISDLIDAGKIDINNFWGALIGLLADFENYLQKIKDTRGVFSDFSDLSSEVVEQYFQEYKGTPTYFLQSLEANNIHLQEIQRAATELLGFKQLTGQEEIEARQKKIQNNIYRKSKGGAIINAGARKIKKSAPDLYASLKNTSFIEWNTKGKDSVKQGRAGALYELIQVAVNRSIKVGGHAATDTFSADVGQLKGKINLDLDNFFYTQMSSVRNAIENYEKKNRADALQDTRTDFELMNKEIEHVMKDLDQMINLPKEESLFIYHESLKLYVQIEEHKTTQFEGRSLNALSALDRIYTMNGYGGLTLPNQEIMYNLILNLSKYAVGGEIKGDVEQYLSIFAGLLMFDDMQNMAKELASNAVNQIQYSNIKNIHLYLLNGIYVPSSLILSYIYRALISGIEQIQISSKNGARVEIETTGTDKEIENYLKTHSYGSGNYDINDWSDEREKISQNTRIQIIFMSAFITFLRDLQQHFQ